MGTVPTFTTGTAAVQSDLAWWIQSRPLAYVYQTTQQTGVASSTWTPVNLQTALVDRDSGHYGSSGRYTIGLTLGYYIVSGAVAFTGTGGSTRAARLVLNGTAVNGATVTIPAAGDCTVVIPPTLAHSTSAGDYVELQCYQDSGSAMSLQVSGGLLTQLFVEFAGN